MLKEDIQDGVSRFMPCGGDFFPLAHGHAAAFLAPAHLVTGFFEFAHGDGLEPFSCGEKRGFVKNIRQFRAGVSGRATGEHGEVYAFGDFHLFGMHFEDFFAALHIGQCHGDLTVEAAWTQERGVEDIRAVCGGNNDDAFLGIETIHFHEELVERLLALVVSTAHAVSAMATHGVDFVNKHQTGCGFFALLEHVANARGADADKHFHEVRTADREEGHIRLASNGAGEQGFAGSRGANHENALGNAAAELLELLGIFQKFHQFLNLVLRLFDAGDILEGDAVFILREHSGLGLAKVQRALACHLDL